VSEHYTLTLRIERVVRPEKPPVYRGSVEDKETTRVTVTERDKAELVNFIIRADSLDEAIEKAIQHLNIERSDRYLERR
jgi:hypothetical protein